MPPMFYDPNEEEEEEKEQNELLRPEELVGRETKVVNFLRCFLFAVLIIVGSSLSLACFKVTSKWEGESYQKNFNHISFRFINGFHNSLAQAFWNANAIGVAYSAISDLGQTAPNITLPLMDTLALGATIQSHLKNVFFAPLLRGDEERRQWEAYAQLALNQQMTGANWNSTDVCHICGTPDLQTGAPNAKVVVPGFPTFSCGQLNRLASSGSISPKSCTALIPHMQENCKCQQITKGANHSESRQQNTLSLPPETIFEIKGNTTITVEGRGPYSPIWQVYPQIDAGSFVMFDLFSDPLARVALETMIKIKEPLISKINIQGTSNLWKTLSGEEQGTGGSLLFAPVFAGLNNNDVIGSVVFDLDFTNLIGNDVPLDSQGIQIVLENSCDQKRTFQSNGITVDYVGEGDLHDPSFSSMMQQSAFVDYLQIPRDTNPLHPDDNTPSNCAYRVSVYSSAEFEATYKSRKPRLYAGVIIFIFIFTSIIFITYDCYVARRQKKVLKAALQRDEIVSSLFPAAVRQRLFQAGQPTRSNLLSDRNTLFRLGQSNSNQLQRTEQIEGVDQSEPIADFLPMVSVVFADISGFTAWSSEREPSQVFQLLETVYRAFDKLATRSGVFKLETAGDCYVAATSIPVYQPDHAIRIIKFAYECLLHMNELVHQMETTLGPGTSSLSIRIGVHSGPVIAGVLRGDKTRFQLFGDTMNTAARMKSTGDINRIQISNTTADLLIEANKSHWVVMREEHVSDKGLVKTFWADPVLSEQVIEDYQSLATSASSSAYTRESSRPWGDTRLSDRLSSKTLSRDDKLKRIVGWNTDLLLRFLKSVVAARSIPGKRRSNFRRRDSCAKKAPRYVTPFEDVNEILPMQEFLDKSVNDRGVPDSVVISDSVRSQLRDYITKIASMYNDNPFHNFEHACHVAMSASKIVMRIIRPNIECNQESLANRNGRIAFQKKIHECTFGISSDFLMQFAVVFSAVIHDVDHAGVSNAQLVKEGREIALRYKSKCVAEQNSVDIAWNLLMQDKYKQLRQCICSSDEELVRFRQLLVNAVIATDIADKELQQWRKKRWNKAFRCGSEANETANETSHDIERKATIVFEYIIQASDVSHTMQHWRVYKRWNERLFEEHYLAYQCGRGEHDPSIGWYKGELWFFDNYIIPLAKKLETCGVFGVSSDEYLSYALKNRREWELKGEEMVRRMVEKYKSKKPLDAINEVGV